MLGHIERKYQITISCLKTYGMVSIKDDISRTNEYLWQTNEKTLYYILQSYLDIKVNILKKKKQRSNLSNTYSLLLHCFMYRCPVMLPHAANRSWFSSISSTHKHNRWKTILLLVISSANQIFGDLYWIQNYKF